MSRSVLGDDALDALVPIPATAAPVSRSEPNGRPGRVGEGSPEDRPEADATALISPKKKRGRPRGSGYGEKKSTRWQRSDGAEMRARSVHIPVDVDRRLRQRAAEEDKPVGQVIVELLERHV